MVDCVRRAWLTLGASSVQLEDATKGYFCLSLDLGYPEVRDVVSNRPDQHGIDDRTQFMGARVVTAELRALVGAGARIDTVGPLFAPFLDPSVRPVLHYVLDQPGYPERTLTLRASNYSGPIEGPYERSLHMSWVAADPIIRDAIEKTATAWAGSSTQSGRIYNLTFNRIYPVGGAGSTTANVVTAGSVAIRPRLRIYGPITAPVVRFVTWTLGTVYRVVFTAPTVVNAGDYIDVSTRDKTAYYNGDTSRSLATSIDWQTSSWPVIPPSPDGAYMTLSGSTTSGITQVQAFWYDGYLA
jgi:hypothetical protein